MKMAKDEKLNGCEIFRVNTALVNELANNRSLIMILC